MLPFPLTLIRYAHLGVLIMIAGLILVALSPPIHGESPTTRPEDQTEAKLVKPDLTLKEFAERQGKARVIVHLKPPPNAPAVVDYNDIRSETAYRTANKGHQDAALARLAGRDASLIERFENQATLVMEVSQAGLAALQKDADVDLIAPVIEMQLLTAQGLPKMGADTYRDAPRFFRGAGVSIAICDTGIDSNHPQLGGGGFPNAKVLGGRDYGSLDYEPIPDGFTDFDAHGTACAGIAAGDVPNPLVPGLDYIGGVAPDARLYALKIFGQYGIWNYSVALAWDWAVTHRNDDPANPILVISNSFGSPDPYIYSAHCDWDGENLCLVTAAQSAVNAGITLFAASGNDFSVGSMRSPACLSNVISVGAVFDTPDDDDIVPNYSNSASFLNLLAPSHNCVSTDLIGNGGYDIIAEGFAGDYTAAQPFGGTSAACPYAAGAAAVLQSATMVVKGCYLTPARVRDYLQWTGTLAWDNKSQLFTPRVNLDRAIEMAIGTWVEYGYTGAELGTVTEPFNTLAEGISAAPEAGLVNIQAGTSNETMTISKAVTLQAWYGTVTIGQ